MLRTFLSWDSTVQQLCEGCEMINVVYIFEELLKDYLPCIELVESPVCQ